MNLTSFLRTAVARLFATLMFVVPPIVFISAGTWLNRQLSIDRCLDHGGRWDHDAAACATNTVARSEDNRIE